MNEVAGLYGLRADEYGLPESDAISVPSGNVSGIQGVSRCPGRLCAEGKKE